MTAEVVVMNKEAIALAADSAITISNEEGNKIFTSANKIFMLSKYYPVAIMFYGNAHFMGIPWETIVKAYRKNIVSKCFNNLKDYSHNFLRFFETEKNMFKKKEKDLFFNSSIYSFFEHIKKMVQQEIKEFISCNKEIEEKEIKSIVKKIIDKTYDSWKKAKYYDLINDEFFKKIIVEKQKDIDKIIKDVFQELPLTISLKKKLSYISVSVITKFSERFRHSDSGIVIAGFGKREHFPTINCFRLFGIYKNKLIYKQEEKRNVKIGSETLASISSFAQGEMVHTFIEGIAPDWKMFLFQFLDKLITEYPKIILDSINKDTSDKLSKDIKKISKKEIEKFIKKFQNFSENNFVNPITGMVANLPKDELAAMAESLVNLTSFKRKITMELETVGGPIDVAVLSKGDGFIWIKRKHYFKPELNQQFFYNYNREE